MTNATSVLRQTIYYPYAWALKYARGKVLDLRVASDTYPIHPAGLQADFAIEAAIPYVDVVATIDPADGTVSLLMLNRDLDRPRDLVVTWRDPRPTRVLACETLTGSDLKAVNTFEAPTLVVPPPLAAPQVGATMTFELPPRSYSVAHLATA
jgi:alpha-N-arabinofuranosidase